MGLIKTNENYKYDDEYLRDKFSSIIDLGFGYRATGIINGNTKGMIVILKKELSIHDDNGTVIRYKDINEPIYIKEANDIKDDIMDDPKYKYHIDYDYGYQFMTDPQTLVIKRFFLMTFKLKNI